MWAENIPKCGEMKDFNRDTAGDATQYPVPELKLKDYHEVLDTARKMFSGDDNQD